MNTDATGDNTYSLDDNTYSLDDTLAPNTVPPSATVPSTVVPATSAPATSACAESRDPAHAAPVGEGTAHEDYPAGDGYRVALIKSLTTNNRFYALVSPESGIHNADAIDNIPHDLVLGIAYPCLEDGLNDFAVVRTAYETLELFSTDEVMRRELLEIITDARRALIRRLMELLERFIARKAHFLGTDLDEFKSSALDVIQRGFPRHRLDHMMKVNVFSSVAKEEAAEGKTSTHEEHSLYRYEFHNSDDGERLAQLSGRHFLLSLLADVLDSVMDEENYRSKYLFDRNVFQQFIALIFMTYSSTDSVFYGIHKDDYGVSRDKDMDRTPLYVAIGRELRRLTDMPDALQKPNAKAPADPQMWADIAAGIFNNPDEAEANALSTGDANTAQDDTVVAPPRQPQSRREVSRSLAHEELLLGQIASICATAQQLRKRKTSDSSDLAQLILADAARLVDMLKQINVISPLAYNPGQPHAPQTGSQAAPQQASNDEAD
jgi:hypothetical protein